MEVPHVDIVKKKLGAEAVAALQALFKAAEGQPPGVPVARFRADHPEWMDVLDKLEHNHSLVERNKECTNYKIRSYALPLIDEASPLLEKMQQLYLRFRVLYQEELNGQQSIKKLLDKVEGDADEWMVALYYLSECHSIWSGKDIGFPYADDSYLCISESVLKNESVAEILSQYYEWHYINNQNRTNNESSSTERHNKIGILGWLQIGMLLFLVLNIVAAVLLYRHQTLHVFANVWTYLGSVKIAAPPLVIAILAVLLAIVHEGTIADLRAKVVRWIRNHLMQHKRMLVITNMLLTSCFLGMAYILMYVTPPEYEVLVSKFLGSENDKFKVIGEKIDAIEKVNSTHAENLRHAANVFKLRAEINSHTIDQRQVLAASLTRALEVNTKLDSGWAEHPLRLHALAESYSIRSESMLDDAAGGPFSKENLVKHALENYKKVANDRSVLSTQLLRTSAVLNTGNLYHYISNYNAALSWWKKALSDEFGGLSTAAWGNVIAGHVLMKEYKEAIAEAKKAEKWAIDNNKAQIEVTNFASIVGNRAFAHAALGEYETALDAFKQSYQAQADAMSKINLSLGYVLANQNSEAIKILRTFLQPVTANNQSKIATSTEQSKCGYFVWQMADMASSKEIAVARLYASIGSAFGSDELRNADDHMLEEAKRRVIEEMQQQAGPCKTLFIIPEIKEKLTQKIGL